MLAPLKTWLYPALIVVLVFAAWSGSWHAGLGKSDFPGHVALMATFSEQIAEQATLHLWTSDWNAGASLAFWYLHPLIQMVGSGFLPRRQTTHYLMLTELLGKCAILYGGLHFPQSDKERKVYVK